MSILEIDSKMHDDLWLSWTTREGRRKRKRKSRHFLLLGFKGHPPPKSWSSESWRFQLRLESKKVKSQGKRALIWELRETMRKTWLINGLLSFSKWPNDISCLTSRVITGHVTSLAPLITKTPLVCSLTRHCYLAPMEWCLVRPVSNHL